MVQHAIGTHDPTVPELPRADIGRAHIVFDPEEFGEAALQSASILIDTDDESQGSVADATQ